MSSKSYLQLTCQGVLQLLDCTTFRHVLLIGRERCYIWRCDAPPRDSISKKVCTVKAASIKGRQVSQDSSKSSSPLIILEATFLMVNSLPYSRLSIISGTELKSNQLMSGQVSSCDAHIELDRARSITNTAHCARAVRHHSYH